MSISKIEIHSIADSSYTDFAVDVGLRVILHSGDIYDGEVTLVPGEYDDTQWVSWGSLHHWMSDGLHPACLDEDGDHDRRTADEIEAVAAKAAAGARNAWEVAANRAELY